MNSKQEIFVPIAIAGIHKSSNIAILNILLNKMQRPINEKRTLGLTMATIELENANLRLINLDGKAEFRDLLWETYIKATEGFVFIVSPMDADNLDLARDWFWKIIDWGNKKAPILFLIINWNGTTGTLGIDEITAHFGLERFSEVPARPIRILEILTPEQENLMKSFIWLAEKTRTREEALTLQIHGIIFYKQNGSRLFEPLFFSSTTNDENLRKIIKSFERLHFSRIADIGLQKITIGEFRITLIKGDYISCVVLVRKNDSEEKTKMVAESLIEFIEAKGEPNTDLIDEFVRETFAKYLPHYI